MTSSTDFNKTWLVEYPIDIGDLGANTVFDFLKSKLSNIKNTKIKVSQNLFKLEDALYIYYWYQNKKDIIIIMQLRKNPQGNLVNLVGKNPDYINTPPYATDLYQAALSDSASSLLFSDSILSKDGLALWKKLLSNTDNVVSVYNMEEPGKSFKTLTNPNELDNYIGIDHSGFRFVLSKRGQSLAETKSFFDTRRYRELSGLSEDKD